MPEEALPKEDNNQLNEPLVLRIQRMNADRLTVVVDSSNAPVEILREKIRQQTSLPVERQRIIFRGRVLKDGERLSSYGIQNESVLHLVERPETITNAPPTSESDTNSSYTSASNSLRSGIAGATANILLHTMQVDPNAGPAAVAQEISRSVMEALRGVMDGVGVGSPEEASLPGALFSNLFGPFSAGAAATSNTTRGDSTTSNQTNNPPPTAGGRFDPFSTTASTFAAGSTIHTRSAGVTAPSSDTAGPAQSTIGQSRNSSNLPASMQSRLLSRPTSVVRTQVVTDPQMSLPPSSPSAFSGSNHQTVRTNPRRALHNLNRELSRLTTFVDGSDLFTSTNRPTIMPSSSQDTISNVDLLVSNLGHFERAYWMLASGCRELREALRHDVGPSGASATLPWDRLANLMALLHELPLLMISQRRLLGSLRAVPPHGSVELPPSLDVPSFLAREEGSTFVSSNTGNTTTTSPLNPMDIIEPPE